MRLVTIFNVQQILINYVSLLFQTQMLTSMGNMYKCFVLR